MKLSEETIMLVRLKHELLKLIYSVTKGRYEPLLAETEKRIINSIWELLSEKRYNHNHDPLTGRFVSGGVDKSGESDITKEKSIDDLKVSMAQCTPIIPYERQKAMIDVTDEYIKTSTPNTGQVIFDKEYRESKHKDEIQTANWLLTKFGGDIKLLTESTIRNQSTPDYLWKGKYWELKTTHSIIGADKLLHHAIKQIQNNPGGVILNLLKELDIPTLESQLVRRFLRNDLLSLDIILLQNGELLKIIRCKK